MIGREAQKPWIFNSDFSYENIDGKKHYTYINFLKIILKKSF